MRRLIAVFILSGLFPLLNPISVSACDCSGFPSDEDRLASWAADRTHIFKGTVIEKDKECVVPLSGPELSCRSYKIRLKKVWKGPSQSTVHVYSKGDSTGQCGAFLEVGKEYILASIEEQGNLYIGVCTSLTIPPRDTVSAYTRKSFEEEFEMLSRRFDKLFPAN